MKNKTLYLAVLVFSTLDVTSAISQATIKNIPSVTNNAPSLWLGPKNSPQGDIMLQDVMIPKDTNAQSTYYSTLNWNAGADGGGYCGLQNSSSGGNLTVFSLWDPSNGDTTASIIYDAPGVTFSRFGGEGTGWHAIKDNIWTESSWYTLLVRRWDVGIHTYFGYWIESISDTSWTHYLTINYPEASVYFDAGNSGSSFIEDWVGSGQNMRKVYYTNGYKRNTTGYAYVPFSPYSFSFTQPNLTTNPYGNRWNAGISGNAIFLQTGGSTTPSLVSGKSYTWTVNIPAKPAKPVIKFNIVSANNTNINWTVPISSTPQFRYTVRINGVVTASVIEPEVRSLAYSAPQGATISLTLEDVLGDSATQSISLVSTDVNSVTNNNNAIAVYPSPNKGSFTVAGVTQGQIIELYNELGQRLSSVKAENTTMYFNIANQADGIYLVRILNTDGSIVAQSKMVKRQ